PIRDGDEVTVRVRFEPRAPDGPVRIERFVDIITRTDEEIARFDLVDNGTGADREAGDLVFSATLPGDPENSIIRYRIVVGDGEDAQVLSPRPSDPFEWHAWFVEPRIETTTRTYQLFITPVDWALMWTNIQGGRVAGCNERPLWDAKVPAVFVFQGRVYDVQVRYQGSRWNRTNGRAISRWSGQRPAGGPLLALSWRIAFPRYREFEGRGVVTLNKLTQGCPGYNAGVDYRLFALADVPSPFTRFVRFHVNGNYYHYMMEYERPDEDMIERYNRLQAEKYPDRPLEPVGHLFKAAGCNCDEGPFGWGDMRILQPHCGHSAEARYAATYDRKTHEWDSYDDLIALIEGLNAARRAGVDEIRAFFEANFDMELLLNYLAIINWSVPFDDMFQNHFIYQRRSDGRWLLAPWDLDQNFGEWKGASASIYMGEQGNPDNRSGWWHLLKDAFLKAYREEFRDHLLFMNNTILHPDNIDALVDIVTAESNPAEAAQSPAGVACSFPGRAASFKAFARQRFEIVNRLAGATVEAGEDQVVFVGETVQFDGSESTPDASDVVTYEWSNGMTGERPTAIFEAPGTYVVTLTVKVQGIPFQDDVTIDVLPMPQSVAIEENGLLVLEAEDAFSTDANGAADVAWTAATEIAGASGAAYLEAKELERRRTFLTRYAGIAPEARYAIRFETPGTYRVWVRALASSTRNDSLHLNLRSVPRDADFALELGDRANGEWVWQNESRRAGPLTIEVAEVGLSFLTLWMRESGLAVDKVVVTQDETFVPEGLGPDASRQGSPSGDDRRFIRGDVDGNGKLQIVDPVRILAWLYRGGAAPECEDWADADDNGAIEIADAVYLLDSIFRRGSLPPAPFGTPGFDPTPDEWSCGDS
ncbi:MAG TPA: CotH kinase family protein, partial [Planctomycetota bacterium]|nr:CotH kinase family protein [Planctomycetota bacterium]